MLVAVRSECEFVRKFPLKYSRGQAGKDNECVVSLEGGREVGREGGREDGRVGGWEGGRNDRYTYSNRYVQ